MGPDSLDGDPGAVQDALERRERAQRLSEQARAQARVDEAVAATLLVSAGVDDRDQNREQADRADDGARAAALYDSADARRDAVADLDGVVEDETIAARVIADTSQARPAEDAGTRAPNRPPAARGSRGKGSQTRSPARRPDRAGSHAPARSLSAVPLCASARRRVGAVLVTSRSAGV